ncbi:uncharacterized protein ColSpa_03205 [Colletotrichum spaethianum]|uniref:Uncharacterized protein n=1 Tax=Colletotrichum spaethianum TaxID=700344 RepID=A0AA37P7B4_9PEZI|nr:uncharacterized protein ColSpa_03205 [Colletotrichum spaethianum]GKT43024.1 hypothetical protein ColSpa_03205 [Colletotrichum spaethianum]
MYMLTLEAIQNALTNWHSNSEIFISTDTAAWVTPGWVRGGFLFCQAEHILLALINKRVLVNTRQGTRETMTPFTMEL